MDNFPIWFALFLPFIKKYHDESANEQGSAFSKKKK